ncbi:MAG: hypothetical protein A2Y77_09850 [Planctomycetes bacterium RBG_13_62_9]|nr:MAG: hypothetical protein A2Y77_09850 [Planctomycetes bacterium RBG_13_62_9]
MFLLNYTRMITWFSPKPTFIYRYGGPVCIGVSIATLLIALILARSHRRHPLLHSRADPSCESESLVGIGFALSAAGIVLGPVLLIPAMVWAHRCLARANDSSCPGYDDGRAIMTLYIGYLLIPQWLWYFPAMLNGSLFPVW